MTASSFLCCVQRRRGLKRFGGGRWVRRVGVGSCNFPREICKFPTEEIMGAQTSGLPLNSPKMGMFSPKFCIFGRKFSDRLFCFFFWGGGHLLPLTSHLLPPRRHWLGPICDWCHINTIHVCSRPTSSVHATTRIATPGTAVTAGSSRAERIDKQSNSDQRQQSHALETPVNRDRH